MTDEFQMFWFSCYGEIGDWEVRLRFSTNPSEAIRNYESILLSEFDVGSDGHGDYDYISDLCGQRSMGSDSLQRSRATRALIVYQYLTATARLFVDCLVPSRSKKDGWCLEKETSSGFNRETPIETFHHLFCNMTRVPTWIAIIAKHGGEESILLSDFQCRQFLQDSNNFELSQLIRVEH